MRLLRTAIIPILVVSACLISAGLSSASVVTIDVATKTATSDDTSLQTLGLQLSGQQVGLCVNNMDVEPQTVSMRYTGLTEPKYDLYVNGAYKGCRTLEQLQQGLQFQVDGSVTDPGMLNCLSTVSSGVQKMYDLLRQSKDPEEQFVFDTMQQAIPWVKIALNKEQAWRSVRVIVAPKDSILDSMEWAPRESDYETASVITNTCWLFQQARHQMYHNVKNAKLRNDAVIALTPVDFTANLNPKTPKPHIYVRLLNKCDVPLTGTVSLGLPAGWKTVGAKLKFSQLKSGKTFSVSCDLTASSKSATTPQEVPVTANVIIQQLDKSAAMKLSATAKANGK